METLGTVPSSRKNMKGSVQSIRFRMDKLSVTCTHLDALFCRFVVVLSVASSPCHMSPQSISDTTIPEMQKWPVHGLSLFNMADSLKYQLF